MIKRVMVLGLLLSVIAVGGSSQAHKKKNHTVFGVGPASVVSSPQLGVYKEQKGTLAIALNKSRGIVTVIGTKPFVAPVPYQIACVELVWLSGQLHSFYFRTAPVLGVRLNGGVIFIEGDYFGYSKGDILAAAWHERTGEPSGGGRCKLFTEGSQHVKLSHALSKNTFHHYP